MPIRAYTEPTVRPEKRNWRNIVIVIFLRTRRYVSAVPEPELSPNALFQQHSFAIFDDNHLKCGFFEIAMIFGRHGEHAAGAGHFLT